MQCEGSTPRRAFLVQVASLVAPAGALAQARRRQTVAGQPGVIDVRDFGAKGDGATDDAPALQKAMAAAAGNVLLIPSSRSVYRVTAMITVDAPVVIEGDAATILFDFPPATSNANGALFDVRSSHVRIRGLTFDAARVTSPIAGVNRYAVRVDPRGSTRYDDIRVDSCAFTNLTQHSGTVPATATVMHAIYCRQTDDLVVSDCLFDVLSGSCVVLIDTQRARIEGNQCRRFGWSGIWLNNANAHAVIRNNTFTGTTASNPSYWGGAIDVMGQTSDAVLPGTPDRDIVIEGNRFIGGVYRYGQVVRLSSTQGALVRGNVFFQCDADQNDPPGEGGPGCENNLITLTVRDITRNNGAHRNVSILGNTFYARGRGWQKAIFATTSAVTPAVNTETPEGLLVEGNQFICPDRDNFFLAHLSLHGRRAGYRHISFCNNLGSAVPGAKSNYLTASVPGAVALMSDPGHEVSGVVVTGNHLEFFGGEGTTNSDCAVHVAPDVTRVVIENNIFTHFARATIVDARNAGDVPLPSRNMFDQPANGVLPISQRGIGMAPTYAGALTASVAFDPRRIASGDAVTTDVRVAGSAMGDFAQASFTRGLQGVSVDAWVSDDNIVSVRVHNATGAPVQLEAGTLNVRVSRAAP